MKRMNAGARLCRSAAWILAAVLMLQLLASSFHKHDLVVDQVECVSCYFVAHFPAPIPPAGVTPLPAPAAIQFRISILSGTFFLATPGFLLPLSQGPPAFPSLL